MIRVGGATEIEVRERKDRVDDAMHATRAAVEEGILPGGGVALLRASEMLKKVRTENDDQKTGVEIVRKALSWPARQIALNAGEDGSVIVGKILEKDHYAYGFDAQSGEYGNMLTKGIIDPTKVVRAALARRGICCRSADHHRSDGGRAPAEGSCTTRHAGRRRDGLLTAGPDRIDDRRRFESMAMRTSNKTVTFARPFLLKGVDRILAGWGLSGRRRTKN